MEVILQALLELIDRHAVNPGRSSVPLHLQPRIPHQPFGNVMRLALQPRLTHAIPPFSVDHTHSPAQTRPLAPPPLRYAEDSQLLQASPPACLQRYSAPCGFCRLKFSLSPLLPLSGCIRPRLHMFRTRARTGLMLHVPLTPAG